MIRPIPKRALPNTVTLYRKTGVDANQVTTYDDGQTIKHVRVDPVKSTGLSGDGEFKTDRYELYYDNRTSSPRGLSFGQLDQVEFNGNRLTIREAYPLYGDSAEIHHWEIRLT